MKTNISEIEKTVLARQESEPKVKSGEVVGTPSIKQECPDKTVDSCCGNSVECQNEKD